MDEEIRNNERQPNGGPILPRRFGSSGVTANNKALTKRMVAQNWKQVKEVFTVAVRKEAGERDEFLDRACSHDEALRKEVESLLGSFDSASNFLESPAYVGNSKSADKEPCLTAGQTLGHYEIIKKLGSGGMGEVYLALDSKLNRSVALKVLFEDVSDNEESKRMLIREACAAATLDHPNICAIFEILENDGRSFIVMQYVEGETLSEILENGPMDIDQAIDVGIQITDALEEAHNHRIIHRDIKPSNIIINEKGVAKVLDFGLAKFIEARPIADSGKRLTASGAVMGTVPYMSPEQLKGRVLDARTDVFSFGAMFFEMVTGRQAFPEDSHAEAISSILNNQPELDIVPDGVRAIIQRSLMKDKRRRYQSAGEIARHLRLLQDSRRNSPARQNRMWNWFSSDPGNTSSFRRFFARETAGNRRASDIHVWQASDPGFNAGTHEAKRQSSRLPFLRLGDLGVLSSLAVVLLFAGLIGWYMWRNSTASDPHSFDSLRSVRLVSWNAGGSSIYKDYSASHDGKMIAFSSNEGGANEGIYIKQTADGKDVRITNDNWNDRGPIWSPDDQLIAFASFRDGKSGIYTTPSLGGNTSLLKVVGDGDLYLRKWASDGSAVFYEFNGNLFRLDLSTKEISQLTSFPSARGKTRFFSVSPNEKEIVYRDDRDGQPDLWLLPIAGGDAKRLTNDKDEEIRPVWHPDGRRILYTAVRDGHHQINQVYTDGKVPDQVTRGSHEYDMIDIAGGSKVIYLTWEDRSDIWAVNSENGGEHTVESSVDFEFWSEPSPDARSMVYELNSAPDVPAKIVDSKIVVKPLGSQGPTVSFSGYNAHWLPDGQRIAFVRRNEAEKKQSLWIFNVANGQEQQVNDSYVVLPSHSILPYNRAQIREFSWSPDSRKVVFLSNVSEFSNILMTSMETKETVDLTQNKDSSLQYYAPIWSPDGKRVAFVSQQTAEGQSTTWRVHIWENGAVREMYSTRSSLRLLGWSDDGSLLVESAEVPLKAGPIDLTLMRLSVKGESRSVGTFKSIYATSMTLSADGQTVAFVSRQDAKDDLWVASTMAATPKRVTANGNSSIFFGSPVFAPDGKTIYFDKQEKLNTISMFENFK
jgi:serine/threonine protein kinase/Tol biopolymer transport system component